MGLEIKFKAAYGDEEREVWVSKVHGSLNGIHIYINNYAAGTIHYISGRLIVYWTVPTDKSFHKEMYCMDDSDAILDRLIIAGWIENNHDI